MSENTPTNRDPMTAEKFSQSVQNLVVNRMQRALENEAPFGFGKNTPLPVTDRGTTFSPESTLKLALLTPPSARETGDGRWFSKKQIEEAGFEVPTAEEGKPGKGVLVEYKQKDGPSNYGVVYHASNIKGLEPENTIETTGNFKLPSLSFNKERLAEGLQRFQENTQEQYNIVVGNLVNQNFKKARDVEQEAPAPEQEAPAKRPYSKKKESQDIGR